MGMYYLIRLRPASQLNREGSRELGELQHMRETKLVRNIDATTNDNKI